MYYGAQERIKNRLPQNTRKFKHVAKIAKERMEDELASGAGKVVFKDYIRVIDKYLIPFFGKRDISTIRVGDLQDYADYRDALIGEGAFT